jgi:hypothetical protein
MRNGCFDDAMVFSFCVCLILPSDFSHSEAVEEGQNCRRGKLE